MADRREPTGLLHCSSHSWKPLRFTQLEQVIPVEDESDFGSLITMKLGTLSHDWLEAFVHLEDSLPPEWEVVATEWDLTDRLPLGWTGTCDYLFVHKPTNTVVVGDLKTTKPEGIAYLGNEPKIEHVIQVSCYHAAIRAWVADDIAEMPDTTVDPDLFVCYLPKGKDSRQQTIMPVIKTAPAMVNIFDRLYMIKMKVDDYVAEFHRTGDPLNKFLAPMPKPELKVSWDKERSIWNVTARPHWTETYMCDFDEALCPRTPSAKVGHYTIDMHWIPRKGFGTDQEIPRPSDEEIRRRQR